MNKNEIFKFGPEVSEDEVVFIAPDGDYYPTNNVTIFYYIRKEIAEKKLTGYRVRYKGKEYPIDSNGKIENWPNGLMDKHLSYLCTLGRIKSERRVTEKEVEK